MQVGEAQRHKKATRAGPYARSQIFWLRKHLCTSDRTHAVFSSSHYIYFLYTFLPYGELSFLRCQMRKFSLPSRILSTSIHTHTPVEVTASANAHAHVWVPLLPLPAVGLSPVVAHAKEKNKGRGGGRSGKDDNRDALSCWPAVR